MLDNPGIFRRVLSAIGHFLNLIFGDISWRKPAWLMALWSACLQRKRIVFSSLLAIILAIIVSIGLYKWYQHLPKPIQVTANITAPGITPVEPVLHPVPLIIDFGTNENNQFNNASVAPLENIGKTVSQGITLSPEMPGHWEWKNDNELIFYPSQDWPAGQIYQIYFEKSVFTKQIKMANYQYSFSTLPFEVKISDLKFYQDLKNPQKTQVVGTVNFNFPVNTKSFEQNASLIMQQIKNNQLNLSAQKYGLTINYDENKRAAYIQSVPINLPTVPRYMTLVINKGAGAASGSSSITAPVTSNVLIPDVGSFLQINNVDTTIARDANDRPQQLLTIETTLGVSTDELQKYLHVYLLPKDMPATALQPVQTDYQWSDPGEVTDDVLNASKLVNLTALPEDHPYPTLHSWQLQASTPRFLYIKIDPGMTGLGNFPLTHAYQKIISVPEIPQEINFLHNGSLMSLSDEKKLTVLIRGIPLVKFSVARVLPNEINHLVSQTEGDFQNPAFINTTFTQNDLSEVFSEKRGFNITQPSDLQYTTLDMNEFLNAGNPKINTNKLGLFLIQAQGWDANNDTSTGVENDRLILITDMGLLVKDNADNTHDIFVQSISQGTPVANVQISLLGRNGLPIATGTTDANGHCALPAVDNFTDDREPTVYIAKNGNDISFIPYNRSDRQLNYSRFDISGIGTPTNNISAFVFTERGIYRPGDEIHTGVIIKQAFAVAQPAGLPLEENITDPRGVTVYDQKVQLPDSGYLTFNYKSDPTSPTGDYYINIYLVKNKNENVFLGSTAVRVEEFLPDRLKVKAQFIPPQKTSTTPGWLSPTDLKAQVNLWNLFGTPATNRRVTAKITLAPRSLNFDQYPDYIFVDPLLNPKQPPKKFIENLTDMETNNTGQALFALNLDRFARATYELTFSTEGYEADGGRGVSTQISSLITPLESLVGYKPDSDLNYLKQNSQHSINFIAIDSNLNKIALENLTAELLSVQTVSTLVKNPDGTYSYQSIQQEKPYHQTPFNIAPTGSNFDLPTATIGDYALVLSDKDGNLISKVYFSIVGASGQPVEKNAELNLKLDKAVYNPGDNIEMQISAPYTGAGLITIERDKVYAYQWFKTTTNNSVQSIPIPADFEGNGYVNVAYVRGFNDNEIYMSPLSYSVVPFSVNHDKQTVQIKLTAPNLIKPGTDLPIQYNTNTPSKIIIFAVDEGILQVTDFATPDPLGFFFTKWALGVNTSQIVDQILPKYIGSRELSAIGGSAGSEPLANNLNPFKRKTEAPVVYWSGILDSNSTPQTVIYHVPDYFNGNLRIMAVAAAANAAGNASQSAIVRGDFVISPNIPTFVAPGDQFTISANIANNLKTANNNSPINISLSTSPGLNIIGPSQQQILIPAGQERPVQFTLQATDQLGNADVIFHASSGTIATQMASTLSIRPANAYQTTLINGSSQSNSKNINITRKLYPERSALQASASTNPLILALGLQGYLENYPYNCTEQVVSTALAQLAIAQQPIFNSDPKIIQQKFNEILLLLRQRLNSDGGISYWPGYDENSYYSQFSTVYAMDYLTEAKLENYPVPDDLLTSGLQYLQNYVKADANSMEDARLKAYAIYVLTRNEIVTTNYITNLQLYLMQNYQDQWQNDITSAYLAASYKLLKNDSEADKLITSYTLQPMTNLETTDFNNALINNAQYLTLLARHFPDKLKQIGTDPIVAIAQGINSNGLNTLSAAYTAEALSAYANNISSTGNDNLSINEILANTTKNLASLNNQYQLVNFDPLAQQIRFNNPNKQLYFYQIKQTGFDQPNTTQPVNNGLEVFREYRDANNIFTQIANLGNEITAHIQMRSLNNQTLDNVAIVDLLPGGFEVVPNSLSQNQCDYVDIREDRVIFYCSVTPDAMDLSYRLRAVNKGNYTAPPIFGQSMYNQSIQSLGNAGKITVQ